MTPDDHLGDLIRDDANSYRPGDGRPGIRQRIRARRRRRAMLRGAVPVAVAVLVAAIVVPTVVLTGGGGTVPATPATGPSPSLASHPSGTPSPTAAPDADSGASPTADTTISRTQQGITESQSAPGPAHRQTAGPTGPTSGADRSATTQARSAPTSASSHQNQPASRFLQQAVFDPRVIPAPGALYVAWDRSSSSGTSRSVLNRVDAATGRIAASGDLDGHLDHVLVAKGSVWAAVSSGTKKTLDRLDPGTLRILSRIDLGRNSGSNTLAAAGGRIWVAAGDRLMQVSLDGIVIGSVTLPADSISTVASNRAGTILIVGVQPADGAGALQRRNPTSGTLITSHPMAGVTAPSLTTVADGALWVSEPTGMMGYVQRFDPRTLEPAGHAIQGSNAILARWWEGRIWVTQPQWPKNDFCADPATGTRLAAITLPHPQQDQILAVAGGTLYFAGPATHGDRSVVYRQPVPQGCRPG